MLNYISNYLHKIANKIYCILNSSQLKFLFQWSCIHGDLESIKNLHSVGFNIKHDNYGIRYASENGHLEIVKFLVSIGCDPTVQNNQAIQYASGHGHLDTVKYLYSIGCDPTANNNHAISYASIYRHTEVVKFLANVGCDSNEIFDAEVRENVINWLNEYKPIFNQCLTEIHGHPRLERTKTENEKYFKELTFK